MREVVERLVAWWSAGEPVVLCTLVDAWSSAPRQPGATMLLGPGGEVVGSLSGGCVESDVHAVAEQVMRDGRAVLRRYGVGDDEAFAVGLPCGGTIEVFCQRIDPSSWPGLGELARRVEAGDPLALCTIVEHPDPAMVGRRAVLGADGWPEENGRHVDHDCPGQCGDDGDRLTAGSRAVFDAVAGDLPAAGEAGLVVPSPGTRAFVQHIAAPPRLLVFGATDFAAAVAAAGAFTGYRVTVCDARATFTTPERFPAADAVVVERPERYLAAEQQAGRLDERAAICVLTHDDRFDVPLLEVALRLAPPCYVGAMGSRRTHERRLARLRERGLGVDELARLHSPIGLDLGARTPQETAISVMAEVVAHRHGGSGAPLTGLSGPVHAPDERA